ncbi:MAG: protein kinase [Planctomycetota bacterium]
MYATLADGAGLPDEALVHPGLRAASAAGFDAIEPIGEGGVAAVWRAADQNTGGDFAVKVVKNPGTVDGRYQTRLLRHEAAILTQLPAGIAPPLIRQGGDNEAFFLVIPYLEGESLDRYAEGVADQDSLLSVCRQVLSNVATLHSRGFSHGDLKPWNVLVDADQKAHLLDFGFAWRLDAPARDLIDLQPTGGTEAFRPESEKDKRDLAFTDRYALGQTLRYIADHTPHLTAARRMHRAARVIALRDSGAASHDQLADAMAELVSSRTRKTWAMVGGSVGIVILMLVFGSWLAITNRERSSPIVGATASRAAEARWGAFQQLLTNDQPEALQAGLLEVNEEQRDWAWNYLWLSSTNPPAEEHLIFPVDRVSDASGLLNGRVAVGTWDGRITMLEGDREVWMAQPFQAEVRHLSVDRKSERLVACDRDGNLAVFSSNGQLEHAFVFAGGRPAVVVWIDEESLHVSSMSGELWQVSSDGTQQDRLGRWNGVVLPTESFGDYLTVTRREAEGGLQATVELFDVNGVSRWSHRLSPDEVPLGMDFHPPTGRIAIGLTGGHVLLDSLDGPNPRRIHLPEIEFVSSLAFDPGGEVVVAAGRKVMVVDARTAEPVLTLMPEVKGIVSGVRWCAYGQSFSLQTLEGVSWWRSVAVPMLASR